MQFNKIIRGANKATTDLDEIYSIIDAGFLCHVSYVYGGESMMIPTSYGRKNDEIYIHGSTKNAMMRQILDGQTICIAITHLDGIVLARTLFDTGVNYRSLVIYGTAQLVNDDEKIEGLHIITENVIKGRWEEVPIGDANELKATMVIKIKIERLSAKVRTGGPLGDESKTNEVWSGQIPLATKALEPIQDMKFGVKLPVSKSVMDYWTKYQ